MTPNYKLITQAADSGGRWCSAEVHLTVTDVNDNPPTFTMSQYTTSVYEDTSIKALLTRIQAIDPDEGDEMNTAHNKITLTTVADHLQWKHKVCMPNRKIY